ncbi:MAG TPA: glycosyltransferase [Ktedonobacterales bacterium]|nr:glycosyltransferase [Ktedonobacterales bacterium]
MRIVLVTDQFLPMVGGVATVTHQLSTHLAARGHHVWVIAPSESWRNKQSREAQVSVYRFSSLEWPAYEGQRVALLPAIGIWRLFKRLAPDIIHIHSPQVLGTLAREIGHALHLPVIATNHFMPINLSRSLADSGVLSRNFSRVVYRYLVGFYRRCDYVTAPTSTALTLLREQGLRTPGEAISNGIDLARFSPGPGDETARQALGLPKDRPLALILTRLMREKRVHVLLEALAQTHQPCHLVIAGSGPEAGELQALAYQLDVSKKVSFLGFVADESLVSLYRLADFFVMPSIAELQSLATLQALACGLPVIAANAGALPELVQPGRNGYLFQPDQSDQLALCLDTLLGQPQQWQAMGLYSQKIAALHDYQRVIEQWETIYQNLIQSANARNHLLKQRSSRKSILLPRS